VILFVGSDLLSAWVPWRIRVDFPGEASWPFFPVWSWVYVSGTVVLLTAPFLLADGRALGGLFASLTVALFGSAIVFLLLPVEPGFAPRVLPAGTSPATALCFHLVDALNLERNSLPSLHVAFSILTACALAMGRGAMARASLALWATAVASSTVLIHEHHLLDVVAGAVVALLAWTTAGRWAMSPRGARALDIEFLCAATCWRLARRHRRYAAIGAGLLAASLPAWRTRRVLRTGFCFLQTVDDLLDGDLSCPGEPLDRVDGLTATLRSGASPDSERDGHDPLRRLAAAFHRDLEEVGGREAVGRAVSLIDTMRFDRRRVLDRLLLDEAELRRHHRSTFAPSLDLMLLAGGSRLRAADVPELIDALGWCSTVRDLEVDLARGLINLPRHVVGDAGPAPDLLANDAVGRWLEAERHVATRNLDATDARLAALAGVRGRGVLRAFARSIRRYARTPLRYSK
jgi:membrane-associated phospholipid phosphatase